MPPNEWKHDGNQESMAIHRGEVAAMTAAHPVASRSPNRTSVCCAGRSAPSQCKMITVPGCSSSNQLDKERTMAYRASAGPDSRPDAHCATNVGNWGEPSGESRFRSIPHGKFPGAGLGQDLSVRHTGALLPFAHYLQLPHISPLNWHCTGIALALYWHCTGIVRHCRIAQYPIALLLKRLVWASPPVPYLVFYFFLLFFLK